MKIPSSFHLGLTTLLIGIAGCASPTQHPDTAAMDAVDLASDQGGMDRGTGESSAPMDVAPESACRVDTDCDDSVFCNGAERCMPGAAGADLRGCVSANPANPCMPGQTCDEAGDRCRTMCDMNGDADGDGHRSSACGGDDCDDADPNRFPGHTEICDAMNHDEDCDPSTFGFRDSDSDGYPDAHCCNTTTAGILSCGTDCDDNAPNAHPALTEVCDGIDNDCDGMIDEGVQHSYYTDADGDGFGAEGATAAIACTAPPNTVENHSDCNDSSAAIHPGAMEVCDGAMVDEDCSGGANEGCSCTGTASMACPGALGACAAGMQTCVTGHWSACSIIPAPEVCNGIDDDCDGTIDNGVTITCYADNDNDSFAAPGTMSAQRCATPAGRESVGGCPSGTTNRPPSTGATDCDDTRPDVLPTATEYCNGIDDNCNGAIDEGVVRRFYPDTDHDGFGDMSATSTSACTAPPDTVENGLDCNDSNPAVHPGATEICDTAMVDEDCDGAPNAGCLCTGTMSQPCPGALGACATGVQTCMSGRWSTCSVMPVPESCNSIDDDCDGVVDNGVTVTCYGDGDNDTYPTFGAMASQVCAVGSRMAVGGCPSGFTNRVPSPMTADCNDARPDVTPVATEVCNGIDDNCDGRTDEGVQTAYFPDMDTDGYGRAGATPTLACAAPMGMVANNGDCNDSSASIHPGAGEVCDVARVDEDCDGAPNEGCMCTGTMSVPCMGAQGVCAMGMQTCLSGVWSTCSVMPSTEVCNGLDDNCNGTTDEGVTTTCFADGDGDGYAPSGAPAQQRCPVAGRCPAGTTSRAPTASVYDCNDASSAVSPAGTEVCNSVDDNCNGSVDEGSIGARWYRDADGDGYGNASSSVLACNRPSGYVSDSSDCNDSDGGVHALAALYQDLDRDGYGAGPIQTVCPAAGWVATPGDCYDSASDSNAGNAHPGQTSYFGTGYPGSGCPFFNPNCNFDWNCDGTLQHQPLATCSTANRCTFGGCQPGPETDANCGVTINFDLCQACGTVTPGYCGGVGVRYSLPMPCH